MKSVCLAVLACALACGGTMDPDPEAGPNNIPDDAEPDADAGSSPACLPAKYKCCDVIGAEMCIDGDVWRCNVDHRWAPYIADAGKGVCP
jgi:hypothetical protein